MNNEEFDETEGADWVLEGEAMFHVRLSAWPPQPGSKQNIKARFTLGYDSGEQDNIVDELNSASIQFRVLPNLPGAAAPVGNCYPRATFGPDTLTATTPWIEMQKVGFDEQEYYLFLNASVELPSEPSSLQFLVVHSSFNHVWHLPLPVPM